MITVENVSKIYRRFERSGGFLGTVKDLFHREYRDFIAVENLSFEIDEGEILGFIGPNGAGKTTMIKMLTGIMHSTSGNISVADYEPFRDRRKLAQNIGVLFGKRSNLIWDLPVEDGFNMLMDLYQCGIKGRERLRELRSIVHIEHLLKVPIRKLSLGQRTLCEIVAAVLHSPRVLFLDEPTIGLDLFAKDQVRNLIRYVNENWGITVFLTTHDLSDISKLAKKVILISKGKKLYDGSLEGMMQKAKELPRAIKFTLETDEEDMIINISSIQGVNNVKRNGFSINTEFNPSIISSGEIVKMIMEKYRVLDIEIPDVDIEDVVRHMYVRGEENV